MKKVPNNPLSVFILEHAGLLVQLKKLNTTAKSIEIKGLSPKSINTVNVVLSILEAEITQHNKIEENALFPVLEKHVEGPTQILREEHKLMFKSFTQLHAALNHVKNGKVNSVLLNELVKSIREVVQVFVNHIHKENYILFPLLNKYLTKDELKTVARKMV